MAVDDSRQHGAAGEVDQRNGRARRQRLGEANFQRGFSTTLFYPVSGIPRADELARAIAADLQEVGIRTGVTPVERSVFAKALETNQYPMYLGVVVPGYNDPDAWFGVLFPRYDTGSAVFSYNNPQVFTLVQQARATLNSAERARKYAQIGQIVSEQVPVVPLAYYAEWPILTRSNVENLIPDPNKLERMERVQFK